MRHLIAILLLSGLAMDQICAQSMDPQSIQTAGQTGATQCEQATVPQWQALLEQSAVDLANNWSSVYSSFTNPYPIISQCWNHLVENKMSSCFENMKNYSLRKTSDFTYSHQMGFNSNDGEYIKQRTQYLQLPDELKNGLPSNYEILFKEKGWKSLFYRSRVLANPPFNQYSRLLVFVPSPTYDRWIQFTMRDIEQVSDQGGTLIDFISVVKIENGEVLEKPKINFVQFQRDESGKNPVQRAFFDRCIRCHPSGMRHLTPAPGSLEKEDDYKTMVTFNKTFDNYGAISWGGELEPEKLSPAFGARPGPYSCVECHNNNQGFAGLSRDNLTAFTEKSHFWHKMGIEYSMTPSVKKEPDTKELFEVLKKFKTLDKDVQKDLFTLYRVPKNDQLIEFAFAKGMIPEDVKTKALDQNLKLKTKMEKVFDQQVGEFRNDLEIWLKGGKENCTEGGAKLPNTISEP